MSFFSTVLIGLATVLDILVAIAISLLPQLNIPVALINFHNSTVDDVTIFNGFVEFNNKPADLVPFQSISQIELGLWGACITDQIHQNDNTTCFSPILGYSIKVFTFPDDRLVPVTTDLVKPSTTFPLIVGAFAGVGAFASLFTGTLPQRRYILGAVLALHVASVIVYIVLFRSVAKIMPSLGSSAPGAGFYFTVAASLMIAGAIVI